MLSRLMPLCAPYGTRCVSSTAAAWRDYSCRLLVVGGGAGGCSITAKFANKLGKNKVIVVEPAEKHYYQAMFTLVGGGMKDLDESYRPMKEVLPSEAKWIKDYAVQVDPHTSKVYTKEGHVISYDFLVLAPGIYLDFKAVPGLLEGLNDPKSGVCTNYSPNFVNKTYKCITKLEKGNAVFTYPNTQIKCAGAPQKIAYITSDYLQLHNKDKPQIIYATALPVIFKVTKYADSLWKVAKSRNVDVKLKLDLKEVQHENKRALFQNLEKPNDKQVIEYEMLHVCPPQRPPDVIANNGDLADSTGFLDVDKKTLRHTRFPNIFGIGDCTNLPTSKTAAAVAGQLGVLRSNLTCAMEGKEPVMSYDGYTSCPLVTGYNTCILAEFDYDAQPLETFPFDQGVERRTMFHLKKDVMPQVYFQLMLRGLWEGPAKMRKALHLGMCK